MFVSFMHHGWRPNSGFGPWLAPDNSATGSALHCVHTFRHRHDLVVHQCVNIGSVLLRPFGIRHTLSDFVTAISAAFSIGLPSVVSVIRRFSMLCGTFLVTTQRLNADNPSPSATVTWRRNRPYPRL